MAVPAVRGEALYLSYYKFFCAIAVTCVTFDSSVSCKAYRLLAHRP